MSEGLTTNKVSVQFTYPFRVRRWDTLRHGLTGFLNETGHELLPRLQEIQAHLDRRAGTRALAVYDAESGRLGKPGKRELRRLRPTDSDAAVRAAIGQYIGQDATSANHTFQVSSDPICFELIELLEAYDGESAERVMRFLCDQLNGGSVPLLRPAKLHLGDDRGTRGYIERRRPFVNTKIQGCDLAIMNPESLPDLASKLPLLDGENPAVRLTASIRLMSTGFGCVALEARLVTPEGLVEWINEIVYQADPRGACSETQAVLAKAQLTRELHPLALEALRTRDASPLVAAVSEYEEDLNTSFIVSRIASLVNGATLISDDLTTEDIVDLANLDRGCSRGGEPHFAWRDDGEVHHGHMFEYYVFVTNEVYLGRLADAISGHPALRAYMSSTERRRDRASLNERCRNEIVGGLSNLSMDQSLRALGEHPYVSTFLSAPAQLRDVNANRAAEQFGDALMHYQQDLVRILMKSKWAGIRHDWAATSGALDNLFYSDLIYMAVDIRSTLCVYYVPTNTAEYFLVPELTHGYKYLVELNETLQEQRILWYAYTLYDSTITQDLRSISAALDGLKEDTLNERFNEVIEGLTEVIRGIDRDKMALAETMHDPLSRKAGSSVFGKLIEKTNDAFQLSTLYSDLSDKLERLDMLGLHVAETVQQYTSLVLQEGTRSAQLTVEFLEAFIIAFYFSELVHLSYPEAAKEEIFALSHWWGFYALVLGVFLAVLPAITLIRRSRSRLAFSNPSWLDQLEGAGMLVGPAILLGLVYSGWAIRAVEGEHGGFALVPNAWVGLLVLLPVYLLVVLGWRAIEHRVAHAAR